MGIVEELFFVVVIIDLKVFFGVVDDNDLWNWISWMVVSIFVFGVN